MTIRPWLPRALPFAVYMLVILIADAISSIQPASSLMAQHLPAVIYPAKTIAVIAALRVCWKHYDELKPDPDSRSSLAMAFLIGVLVFVLWIHMDWPWAVMGSPEGYDPTALPPALM